MNYNREELIKLFAIGIHEVNFTKVDGSIRIMKCSLDPRIVFEIDENYDQTTEKVVNENNIHVWDLENNGWRTIRVDSINSIKSNSN